MAHFAKVNSSGMVEQVVVVNNDVLHDENGIEQESIGVAFCQSLFGADTEWIQTSYNGKFRGRFAGAGGAGGPVLWAHCQFHQWRIVGPHHRCALGDGVSARRIFAAPSQPVIRGVQRRACAIPDHAIVPGL